MSSPQSDTAVIEYPFSLGQNQLAALSREWSAGRELSGDWTVDDVFASFTDPERQLADDQAVYTAHEEFCREGAVYLAKTHDSCDQGDVHTAKLAEEGLNEVADGYQKAVGPLHIARQLDHAKKWAQFQYLSWLFDGQAAPPTFTAVAITQVDAIVAIPPQPAISHTYVPPGENETQIGEFEDYMRSGDPDTLTGTDIIPPLNE